MRDADRIPEPARDELVARLNVLLEAERAGARVVLAYMTEFEPDSAVHAALRAVQHDEAANCGVLLDLVRRLGGEPSAATGDFAERALALREPRERLAFLNRGQGWVVRRLEQILAMTDDAALTAPLTTMRDSHATNIATCDALMAGNLLENSARRGYSSPPCSAHEIDPEYDGR